MSAGVTGHQSAGAVSTRPTIGGAGFRLRQRSMTVVLIDDLRLARYAARNENFVLVVREPHNGLDAPQARPPARSGDRGAPASDGVGGSAGAEPPGI